MFIKYKWKIKLDTNVGFIILTNDTSYKSITLNNQFRKQSQKKCVNLELGFYPLYKRKVFNKKNEMEPEDKKSQG